MPIARPDAEWICTPCAWTLSDRVSLPASTAEAAIVSRATSGGRLTVCVGDDDARRYLALLLADGHVGLWVSDGNAASEEPWMEAREALRAEPVDVGDIAYHGSHALQDIRPAPAAKFRNFHHFASRSRGWNAWTNADRQLIRAWLLDPPDEPWAGVIGDGQKHAVTYAEVSPGRGMLQTVYLDREMVRYEPEELSEQVDAVEQLVIAGATNEEIVSGRYSPRGYEMLMAIQRYDGVLAPIRGGAKLQLAVYLRRPVKELKDADG